MIDPTAARPQHPPSDDPLPGVVSLAAWPPVELASGWALTHDRGAWYERPPWPRKGSLEYTKLVVTVGLLMLALPYLVGKLSTNPGELLEGAGRQAVKRAGSG